MSEIRSASSLTAEQLAQSLTGNVTQSVQVTSEAPTLPAATETPEYYTGFAQEFDRISVELQQAMTRLQNASNKLPTPLPHVKGWLGRFLESRWGYGLLYQAEANPPPELARLKQEAQAEFDAASNAVLTAEWKQVIMATLPIYMSDPSYDVKTAADVLNLMPPGFELTDADNAWLQSTFTKLQPLTNIVPEGYEGDILETQSNILNNILTAPKLELAGVHRLTIDEIAKSFALSVADLPAGMTEGDVRNLLSDLGLESEELKTQREWLAERAKEWEVESARMSMIKAGTLLAETPELTPLNWARLIVTQPMMATVELMQKWWDAISRPIAAAVMMNLPAPVAGATLGLPVGIVAGGTAGAIIGAIGGPIGMGAGAIIGAIVGMIGGAAWLGANTADEDKELTKHYEFYRSQGDSAWASYAQAFNAWEAPWWKKMILDSAYDPLMWIGWGGVAAVGTKLTRMALPRGLKVVGTRIGNLMVAFENGYVAGMDAIFKVGMQVVASPIKSAFWLTGAGYKIPATFTQMARNFAKQGTMDLYAVVGRVFRDAKNVLGKGLTGKDALDIVEASTRAALKTPMEGNNPMVKFGVAMLEFPYLDDVSAAKFMKDIAGDILFDTTKLVKFNTRLLDAFSGQIPATGEAMNRIVAGNILGDLGIDPTGKVVTSISKGARAILTDREKLMLRVEIDSVSDEIKEVSARLLGVHDLSARQKIIDQIMPLTRKRNALYLKVKELRFAIEDSPQGIFITESALDLARGEDAAALYRLTDQEAAAYRGLESLSNKERLPAQENLIENILKREGLLGRGEITAVGSNLDVLAARISKFKDTIASKALNAVKADGFDNVVKNIYTHLYNARYANLHSPLTRYMQQAGRSASWHSRVADRILYSAQLVALERRMVMPIARWQLLFTNFGPWNYIENTGRSFLGGGELMYPKAYGGAAETNRVMRGLVNAPYESIMFEKGQTRLTQAMIDPTTGTTAVFKGGSIPFVTRGVKIPDKIPFFGGKMIGKTITIGDQKFFIGSAQDWYDMWGKLTSDLTSYDNQVHFLKALEDIAPDEMKAMHEVIEVKTKSMLDDIASITKGDAFDIRRELTLEAIGGGPNSIRAFADIDVITLQRRMIKKEISKRLDNFTDIHSITKISIEDDILDGSMFTKGYDSIDERMAAKLAAEREMSIASLANQMDNLKAEVEAFTANPPKNLQDFLGDMQSITADIESVSDTVHYYRRITELRKAKLNPADFDNFEVGSAKMLAEYMEVSEESLTKMMNQLMENAKAAGLTDVQLARLTDLYSITRLRFQNILATRDKLAEIESVIPRTPRRLRNDKFWASQRPTKSTIWDEYDTVARKLESMELGAKRNFLMSVDKSVFVPDFVPEVTGELTANHIAYLYGATGDDLYRGLTRVQHHITTTPKEDFILHTKDQASAYAAKFGKTAEELGFTDEAIGEVYDQMCRSLGWNPDILTPDSPTAMQLEEIRQEIYRLYATTKIPESDVIKWRQYVKAVADGVADTSAYKGVAAVTPTVMETGQPFTIKAFRGTKLRGEPPTDEGLVGKAQYWSTDRKVAETYDTVRETTINLQKPYVIKTQSEWDTFSLRTKELRGIAEKEGRTEDWVQAMLRSQLENEGYDGVIVEAGIVEKGRQIAVFHPEKAAVIIPPTAVVPTGVSGTPDWWAKKEQAAIKGNEMHHLAYPDYDHANMIDESMRAIFPFWNYELFRWKWIPRTFMRTPGTMSALARYVEYTDSGYVPIPGTDLQVNPLRGTIWMGGLRSFYLRDFPEYHDAAPGVEFLDYIGRAGFFPGIHVMLPVVMFGAAGKQPQLGQLAPAWIKTSLSALRALSPEHIGKVLDIVYPDRFRDYMTMMTLGSMGYDADEIWKKKQQGIALTPDEEKLWLQAEAKVDGVKGILMNQTGLFRIRPQDFLQVRKEMRLAIEEATGVPIKTQEWIDKMYPVTGKRFTDYYHLDILQQALLYQWESYRRYQGITTPLYPSSWQALDIKISDYYDELNKVYNDARYVGVYEDGKLVQPSIVDINRQLVEGIIGPSQWISMRNNIQDGLSEAVRILGKSPAYKDVPKTFEERAALLEERGIVTPTQTPDQELLYYYYELRPELKYNWESDRMELDYDTYYAYVDALLESLSPTFRERLLQRIQLEWTPMEKLYWNFSRTYARPYRNLRDIVLREYTDEQVKLIRRFEVARGDEREQLLEVMGPEGKLIAGYQRKLREARLRLRLLDSELDAWLYFFGTTDKFMSTEAEEIYNDLKKQYLIPEMVGEAK